MDHREALLPLTALLGGEVIESEDEVWYSIPTGNYQEAIEVNLDDDPEMPFQVWLRAWDRTHGLSHEQAIASYASVNESAVGVATVLTKLEAKSAALEALFAEAPDTEDSEG